MNRSLAAWSLVVVACLVSDTFAQKPISPSSRPTLASPKWSSSYSDAYHAAKDALRPVLVVIDKPADAAYRVDQVSARTTQFSPAEAAVLANYELCHIDGSTEYGQKIARSFGAKQLPYIAITDKKVDVILFENAGAISQERWTETLAKYRKGERIEPEVCFT